MTQPNFDHMTRHELLAYVRSHPEDTEAFHKYMDLLQNAPGRIQVKAPMKNSKLKCVSELASSNLNLLK